MPARYRGKAPDEIEWVEPERQSRAVKEYLAGLDADAQPNPDRKPPAAPVTIQTNSRRAFSTFGLTAGQPGSSRIGQYLRNTHLSGAATAGLTRAGRPALY